MRIDDAPIVKFEPVGGMFFVFPTFVIDEFGIGFIWLFWVLAFLWRKEE